MLKYVVAMQLDMQLAAVCKAANKGAPLIFLAADWLYSLEWR